MDKAFDYLRVMGVCVFCKFHTHDFPDDETHERLHEQGWHTCEVDGVFRQHRALCPYMRLDEGVWSSVEP